MEFRCAIYYSEKGIALVGDPYHVLSVVGASLGVDWVEIVGGVVGGGGGGEERRDGGYVHLMLTLTREKGNL